MKEEILNDYQVQQLNKQDKLPFDLLLLADESRQAIEKYIHTCDVYALQNEERIIAVYALQTIDTATIEIKNIAVAEKYQGQGIGTFLLRDATDKAIEKGAETITIGTGDASIKQLYLYQKEGFEVFDLKKRFFLDNYPKPIFENGIQLKHMIMLKKDLT